MDKSVDHICQFRQALTWSEWNTVGGVREREGRRIARCITCERVRPVRKHRPPELIERETITRNAAAISGEASLIAGMLARIALRRPIRTDPPRFRMRNIIERLGRRGWAASATEPVLESLVGAGFARAGYRLRGSRSILDYLALPDAEALYDLTHPGERAERVQRLADARASLESATHPVAKDIRQILSSAEAEKLSVRTVLALAALARHVESGDVLSANVFSARHLGDSKELRKVRARLERLVGPLELLGVRDGGATLLVGGNGSVLVGGMELALNRLRPFVGLPRSLVTDASWNIPADGVLVVENLAAFEAACAGEVPNVGEWLFVWSAGYPSRAVRYVVDAAARAGRTVRVWADLDLDGIRIARLIGIWAGQCWMPWRMSPDDVRAASVRRPLSDRARTVLQTEVSASPDAPLAETLRALVEIDAMVEQEVFVGGQAGQGAFARGPAL